MKTTRITGFIIAALWFTAAVTLGQTEADGTYKEIQQTFGFVPTFFKSFPEHGIAGAWGEMKALEMNPKTMVPAKTKELIGLAVAAQIPCRYCVYFHTSVAKANGATDEEIKEAIAMSALTRHWSTTLNGMQVDPQRFRDDVTKMFQGMNNKQRPANEKPVQITDAQSAYKDMEQTVGVVPMFMRQIPEASVAPVWREIKALAISRDTALDGKTKHLVGLGVSAQIPCGYCTFFDTTAAKKEGASDQELQEAVEMAAITRQWSTVLNGSMIDETAFRKDVDRIVKTMEANKKAASQP